MRSAIATAAVLGASSVLAAPGALEARLSSDPHPTIVQLFEWNWSSVQAECPTIGQLGYKYVQVSPPAEHITGDAWWTSYQRVSSNLVSKRGNRDQFASMIAACNSAGVGVIVDVILNHMAASGGTGTGGLAYSQYNYPGFYSGYDFHYQDQCGTKDESIDDWNNKTQIQFCQLSGLADLKTESDYVRQSLVNHLNDILSLGAVGFRFDAAKHMPVADLQNIYGRLSKKPYVVSEVVGNGAPIPPSDYVSLGTVTVTQSYTALQDALTGSKGLASLNNWENGQGVSSGAAAVFVATHDSERGDVGGSLTVSSPHNAYTLANVFLLAYPYGTPTVLSSYQFKTKDDGAPNGGAGSCSGTGGSNGFNCQHRWTAVANMAQFRAAVGAAALTNWQTGSNAQIAFGRGSAGFVAINNADAAWSTSLSTSLPAGTYCDVVAGTKSGSACTGSKATVSGGKITLSVPARGALAFYTGMKL